MIQFAPGDGQLMQFACLLAHWTGRDKPDLLSFALVTDEPPPEVVMAGRDRCSIPLQPAAIDTWLAAPARGDYQALLDERERPYYAHQLAAAA